MAREINPDTHEETGIKYSFKHKIKQTFTDPTLMRQRMTYNTDINNEVDNNIQYDIYNKADRTKICNMARHVIESRHK